MTESRVSQLLKISRSRHLQIINPQLRQAAKEYHREKAERKQAIRSNNMVMHDVHFLQKKDCFLQRSLASKKKEFVFVQSVRNRYLKDIQQKEQLSKIRREELEKNIQLAKKVKQERERRIMACQYSRYEKKTLAQYYRQEKEDNKSQQQRNKSNELEKNQSLVQKVVEFEYNLKESFLRIKESQNKKHLQNYRHSIRLDQDIIKRTKTETNSLQTKRELLTENTSRKQSLILELNKKIKSIKYHMPKISCKLGLRPYAVSSKNRRQRNTSDEEKEHSIYSNYFLKTEPTEV